MKKLLLSVAILSGFTAYSTQPCNYQCNGTQVTLNNNTLTNQAYNGDVCFTGDGTVANSVSINNWNSIFLNGNINFQQTINMNNGNKWLYFANNKNYVLSSLNVDVADTIVIGNNSNVDVQYFVHNNSSTSVIYLKNGSSVTINNITYNAPTTTAPIQILSCGGNGTPLGTGDIEYFVLRNGKLNWEIRSTDVITTELQYLNSTWENIKEYGETKVSYTPTKTGVYRLKVYTSASTYYSKSIVYKAEETSFKMYNTNGNPVDNLSNMNPYEMVIVVTPTGTKKMFVCQLR